MAWNRPTSNTGNATSSSRPSGRGKMPRLRRGLIAGVIVVLGAGLAAWLLMTGEATSSSLQKKDRGLIEEAQPAKSRKAYEKPKRREVVKTGDRLKDALARVEASGELVTIDAPPSRTGTSDSVHRSSEISFNSGVEQLMCWVFSHQLGDPPVPIPSISEQERANMANILISRMEIKEDDSDRVKELKETVDYAKKEMAKFIGDGGDPEEFLRYYSSQLAAAFDTYMDAQHEYDALVEEDPSIATAFAKRANQLLAEKGIKPIEEDPDLAPGESGDADSDTETQTNTETQS